MKKFNLVALLLLSVCSMYCQDIGGRYAFEFLRLSQSAHASALGGYVVANASNDISLVFSNPALLKPSYHTSISLSNNFYYGNSQLSNMMYAHHIKKIKTTFGFGFTNLNYGTFQATDHIGNTLGNIHASDFCLQLVASRKYLERWNYGSVLKFANSQLADRKSSAILTDFGITYADSANKLYFGAVVKNVGFQLKKYNKNNKAEPMPFDMQIGVVKQFKKAPFRLSVLAHHLYDWDIRYSNPLDIVSNQLLFVDTNQVVKQKKYFADKLFRHLVFAMELSLGKHLVASFGYNHLRRSELAISDKKGMAGFSMGAGLYLNKFTINYARNTYHVGGAYNEIGINMKLNQLFGIGGWDKKINWSERFL
jgi:hypothetical protein